LKKQKKTSKVSSVTLKTREEALKVLSEIGYCVGCTSHNPSKEFCLNCGKPYAPELKKIKKDYYKIICPYCQKEYEISSFEKHIKNMHSKIIIRHFR